MQSKRLLDLRRLISNTDGHLIHGLLIVKDGKLVFEEYWPGIDMTGISLEPLYREFDRDTLHYAASVSKSFTSALVGIARDRGFIGGVDQPLFGFFPDYAALENEDNEPITLEHLLAFSSGLEWNEHQYGFDDPRDSHNQMFRAEDPVAFLLGRPLSQVPGQAFLYNSGDTNLVGEIVRRQSAASTLGDFAEDVLFAPLGIDSYQWARFPLADEMTFASGGGCFRPRDMAKLGALYLQGGVWRGTRIVSESWVAASTQLSTPLGGDYDGLYGYGYNWWLGRSSYKAGNAEYFRALGWGGQDVFVYPDLGLIVVFTAGRYWETGTLTWNDLLEDYILTAIQ